MKKAQYFANPHPVLLLILHRNTIQINDQHHVQHLNPQRPPPPNREPEQGECSTLNNMRGKVLDMESPQTKN